MNLEDYLDRSKSNVMRLNKMIGELYDATKFNSGQFSLEKTTFDFEEMIEEALDTLEVLHPDYSIIVEGECTRSCLRGSLPVDTGGYQFSEQWDKIFQQ